MLHPAAGACELLHSVWLLHSWLGWCSCRGLSLPEHRLWVPEVSLCIVSPALAPSTRASHSLAGALVEQGLCNTPAHAHACAANTLPAQRGKAHADCVSHCTVGCIWSCQRSRCWMDGRTLVSRGQAMTCTASSSEHRVPARCDGQTGQRAARQEQPR